MPEIKILSVCHQKHQPPGWALLRPDGLPAYQFLHFSKPVMVVLDGEEYVTDNNACILYPPGQWQEYRDYTGLYINDFITFQADDCDFAARFNIPENELFYVRDGEEIVRRLSWLTWATATSDATRPTERDINQAVLDLFTVISELHIDNQPRIKRTIETKQRFIALRDEMRKNPKNWTVEQMAKKVWLTRSRFSILYSKFFNISPNADLINMKIEYAKKLLTTTDEPISKISDMCGYARVEYFIRMFNERVEKTPLQYRKANR